MGEKRNIVVIGASSGGFEAIKKLISQLPANLDASIFIVWHIAPAMRGVLPEVINRLGTLPAAHGVDGERIETARVYVARPDHHLLIEDGILRVTKGPRENRFRPAIDPLFRSAAVSYNNRVIGIVLSGALDDGSAGLWAIKQAGGLAVVQDPQDAEVPSMPEAAMRAVQADHILPVDEMGALVTRLVQEVVERETPASTNGEPKTEKEIKVAMDEDRTNYNLQELGELSIYTCPECHGVLTSIREGKLVRFRCHTGHAFSADTLLAAISEQIEDNLWSAIRIVQENVFLLNHMGDHFAEHNQPKVAALYFKKAKEARQRAEYLKNLVTTQEQMSISKLNEEVQREKA
jgi:two-component system, chemotaxis family, protein-glutamate methylesterase/glutaminase